MADSGALADAFRAWSSALGNSYVISDAGTLAAASTATFSTESRVRGIIRPATRQQVQESVRIANEFGVPLYPISTGKNWGYGSRVPVSDGVILDLGRLNRIVDFNEELGYVTIEPGVTQRQLFTFLNERRARWWMDSTGASPDCSIVGNTLERGFGHTAMADHCGTACGFEVVLPTGQCIETGFGRFPSAVTGPVNRWGVGPSLDGLFSQSNFGIVTRMTVWLMPEPEAFQAFFFTTGERHTIGSIIDALRPLRMNGTLRSAIHITNDYKVLAASGQFPWEELNGSRAIDVATLDRLRRRLGVGSWSGSGGLYGTKAQVRDAHRQLRRVLAGKVERLQFVDDRLIRIIQRFGGPFRLLTGWDARRIISVITPVYGLLKGVPTDAALPSVYWRKKAAVPEDPDPDRDGCGLLWCSPAVPSTGPHVTAVTELASELLLENGFEPQMSISLATERTAICVISMSYDRGVPGADERASRCYARLTELLMARGYPPYRLNVRSMNALPEPPAYADLLRSLKAAFDPNGIVAPGRYEPPLTAPARDGDFVASATP